MTARASRGGLCKGFWKSKASSFSPRLKLESMASVSSSGGNKLPLMSDRVTLKARPSGRVRGGFAELVGLRPSFL